ncbi:MAG: hypothetical protein ACJAS4_003923 [Bacteriovoracaceae bacterium]|jgi:phosphatidylserine decarboxylase
MLSIVGGPLVGTIKLPNHLSKGSRISIGEKLASFEMGSTCCLISPLDLNGMVGQHTKLQ